MFPSSLCVGSERSLRGGLGIRLRNSHPLLLYPVSTVRSPLTNMRSVLTRHAGQSPGSQCCLRLPRILVAGPLSKPFPDTLSSLAKTSLSPVALLTLGPSVLTWNVDTR